MPTKTQWQQPSQAEQAEGVIALMPLIYYCQLENGHLQAIDYSGGSLLEGNKKNARTPRIYRFLRYTGVMLERRSRWTDDLPDWWKG